MRSISRLISLIICLLALGKAYSQELTFEETTYNFGKIAEDGGVVSHSFKYKSTGKAPAVIVTAVSSCGCTVPSYSRQPVAVGTTSTIDVTFDPMDRPGKFSKTIQIVIAPHNKRYVLIISGEVIPRKKSIAENYPFDMGKGLRFASNYFALSNIGQGEVRKSEVSYINDSKKPIKLTLRPYSQSGILEVNPPTTIAPGEKGSFEVGYDLQKNRGRYGILSDKLYVHVNGLESQYRLMVNGYAVDSFTKQQRSAPPISNRDKNIIKFGDIKQNRISSKQSFTLENSGVSDLLIRDVNLGDGIKCNIKAGDKIAAGAKRNFQVWIDSNGTNYGGFSRYITLTLNDPDEPVQRVRVTANVIH
ncbi:MAG: DUF1573 domain-containing protein [Rikenellaceae bacterium]